MKKYKHTQTFTFEGHRYYVHADTAKELGAKMALKKRELQEGTPTSDMTVRDWTNHAIRTYKTRQSPVTREKYMKRVNHNVLEHIGWMKLKDVKPVKLQEVINLTAGCSQRHINEVYQIIGFIFSTAYDNNLIRTNPAKGITRPGGTRSQVRSMTEEERTAFLKVHKDPRFRVFSLMYYCGCRPSEAMEARAEDVQTLGNMHVLHIRGTKTRNADRIVPIHTDLYDLIHNSTGYIADHHGEKHSRTSYRRITDRLYREMDIAMGAETYRNHIVTSKLSQDFHPYCLRHTFCTDLARKGIDIRTAQKLMGHSDIQTTVNIYTHIDESFIEDVGAVMGAVRVQQGCNTL